MGFNELETDEIERLAYLMEELSEASAVIGKIIRHGYDSVNPTLPSSDQISNRQMLETELADIMFAVHLMRENGDIDQDDIISMLLDAKIAEPLKYFHHQLMGVEPAGDSSGN